MVNATFPTSERSSIATRVCSRRRLRREELRRFALDQVDWVLGRNPFDVCMLQGRGRNAPDYLPGFPNAPGCSAVALWPAVPADPWKRLRHALTC